MITAAQPQASADKASLEDRIAAARGHLNACFAALVELIRQVIETKAWHDVGRL